MPQNVSHDTTEQSDRTPNSKQLDFIENFQRDIVLFAGAGTGKTFSVAQKCKKAIELGYDPGEILCLTFTEKGKELARVIFREAMDVQKKADAGISEEELEIFYSVLERLQDNLSDIAREREKNLIKKGETSFDIIRKNSD